MARTPAEELDRVLDGDTLDAKDGTRYRIANIDTPETSKSPYEANDALAEQASGFLDAFIANGGEAQPTGEQGRYGREIANIRDADGRDYGFEAIRHGMAQPAFDEGNENYTRAAQTVGAMEVLEGKHRPDPLTRAIQQEGSYERRGIEGPDSRPADGVFGTSVARGGHQMQASLYGFTNALAELSGDESIAEWSAEGLERNLREAAHNPARIESWDDVDSLDEFGTFVIESLGTQAPQLATDIAFALTGAGLGAVAGRRVIAKSLLRQMGPHARGEIQERFSKAQRQGGVLGARVAAGASMYGQSAGETQMGLIADGVDAPGTALLAGLPKTALEYAPLEGIVRSATRVTGMGAGDLGRVATRLMGAAGIEGTTEGLQTTIDFIASSGHTGEELFTPERLKELRTAVAAGAVVGGGIMGGASLPAAYRMARARLQNSGDSRVSEDQGGDPSEDIEAFTAGVMENVNLPEGMRSNADGSPFRDSAPEFSDPDPRTSAPAQPALEAPRPTTREPRANIQAQVKAFREGDKPAVFVSSTNQDSYADLEAAASEVGGKVATTDEGMLITRDEGFDTEGYLEASDDTRDAIRAQQLGYLQSKADIQDMGNTQIVIERDEEGNAVSEQVVDADRAEEAVAHAGGRAEVTDPVTAQLFRALDSQREEGTRPSGPDSINSESYSGIIAGEDGGRRESGTEDRGSGAMAPSADQAIAFGSSEDARGVDGERPSGGWGADREVDPVDEGAEAGRVESAARLEGVVAPRAVESAGRSGRNVDGGGDTDGQGRRETGGEGRDTGFQSEPSISETLSLSDTGAEARGRGESTAEASSPSENWELGDDHDDVFDAEVEAGLFAAPSGEGQTTVAPDEYDPDEYDPEVGDTVDEYGDTGFQYVEGYLSRVEEREAAAQAAVSVNSNNFGEEQATRTRDALRRRFPTQRILMRVATKMTLRRDSALGKAGEEVAKYAFASHPKRYTSHEEAARHAAYLEGIYPNSAFEVSEEGGYFLLERYNAAAEVAAEPDNASTIYAESIGKIINGGFTALRRKNHEAVVFLENPHGVKVPMYAPSLTHMGRQMVEAEEGGPDNAARLSEVYERSFLRAIGEMANQGWTIPGGERKFAQYNQVQYRPDKVNGRLMDRFFRPDPRGVGGADTLANREAEDRLDALDVASEEMGSRGLDAQTANDVLADEFDMGTSARTTFLLAQGMDEFILDIQGENRVDNSNPDSGSRLAEETPDGARVFDEFTGEPIHDQQRERPRDEEGRQIPGTRVTRAVLDEEAGLARVKRQRTFGEAAEGPGVTQARAEQMRDEFLADLRGNLDVPIHMIDDPAKINNSREWLDKYGASKGYVADLGGGRSAIVVFPANHSSPADLYKTLRHETLAHVGLADFFTQQERERFLSTIRAARNTTLRREWEDVSGRYADASPEVQAEEVLALVAEEPAHPIWRALRRLFERVLRRLGFLRSTTREDLEQLLDRIREAYRNNAEQRGDAPVTNSFRLAEAIRENIGERTGRRLWARTKQAIHRDAPKMLPFVFTADAELRAMGTVGEVIADLFAQQSSSTSRSGGNSYFPSVASARARWTRQWEQVIEELGADRVNAALDELSRAPEMLEDGQSVEDVLTNPDARRINDFLHTYRDRYLSENIKGIGKLDIYYPRMFDTEQVQNRRGELKNILIRHFRGDRVAEGPERIFEQSMDQIIDNILDAGGGFEFHLTELENAVGPGFQNRFSRQLRGGELNNILTEEGFFLPANAEVVNHYIASSTKRSEFERVFGEWARFLGGDISPLQLGDRLQEFVERRDIDLGETDPRRDPYAAAERLEEMGYLQVERDEEGNISSLSQWAPAGKLKDLMDELPTQAERERANKIVQGYMGRIGIDSDPRTVKVMDRLMVYESFLTLMFSAVASIPDLAGPILRSRDLDEAWRALKTTGQVMANWGDHRERARTLGLLNQRMTHQALKEAYGLTMGDQTSQRMLDKLFHWNGQEYLTNFSRTMSAAVAEQFLISNAEKATAGDVRAQRYLRELNISAEQVQQWEAEGKPAWTPDDGENNTLAVQNAIYQFTDESVIRPNASQRPVWANHPMARLIWHLKSFFWAYGKIVLGGLLREVASRRGERGGSQLAQLGDQGVPLAIAGMMLMPLAALARETREEIQYFGNEEEEPTNDKTPYEYFLGRTHDAGLWGPVELAFGATRFGAEADEAAVRLAGPTFEHVYKLLTSENHRSWANIKRSIPVVNQMPVVADWMKEQLDM